MEQTVITPRYLVHWLEELAEIKPPVEAFVSIARWRASCGDGNGAAIWQRWSLLPPPVEVRLQAVGQLWLQLGQPDRAEKLLGAEPNWERLAQLLQQTQWVEAENLQGQLLGLRITTNETQALSLAQCWQKARRPDLALPLLQAVMAHRREEDFDFSTQLCNAMAALLEEMSQPIVAIEWWKKSLLQQPLQLPVLMRIGKIKLQLEQPILALHYANQVLLIDPAHPWAPELRIKALEELKAKGSLLLSGVGLATSLQIHRQQEWRKSLANELACEIPNAVQPRRPPHPLNAFELMEVNTIALLGSVDGLCLAAWALAQERSPRTQKVWLLGSHDPLLPEHNLRVLMGRAASSVELISWPCYETHLHGDLMILVLPRQPVGRPKPFLPSIPCWQETRRPRGWNLTKI